MATVAASVKKQAGEEDKDEVWSRLNELATCALVGFGFFTCKVGAGTYNRERKAAVLRQTTTDRDSLWDLGIRVPFGNRFSHASAALTWGCLHGDNVPEEAILLSDCHPRAQELYDAFTLWGRNMSPEASSRTLPTNSPDVRSNVLGRGAFFLVKNIETNAPMQWRHWNGSVRRIQICSRYR